MYENKKKKTDQSLIVIMGYKPMYTKLQMAKTLEKNKTNLKLTVVNKQNVRILV